jgi:hypothetical protein
MNMIRTLHFSGDSTDCTGSCKSTTALYDVSANTDIIMPVI